MMMNNLQSNLQILGYTQQWLDDGILTEAQLQAQLTAWRTGEDPHTEHYRYQTLSSYITLQTGLSNNAVSNLLDVLINDPDSIMASSATILLLKQAYLNDEQFEMVAGVLATHGDWTQKEIVRKRELRCNRTLR